MCTSSLPSQSGPWLGCYQYQLTFNTNTLWKTGHLIFSLRSNLRLVLTSAMIIKISILLGNSPIRHLDDPSHGWSTLCETVFCIWLSSVSVCFLSVVMFSKIANKDLQNKANPTWTFTHLKKGNFINLRTSTYFRPPSTCFRPLPKNFKWCFLVKLCWNSKK